jgi:hypothetical protein
MYFISTPTSVSFTTSGDHGSYIIGANRGFGDFETGCNREEKFLFESPRGTVTIAYFQK